MKALTIKQPWAWAIAAGLKRIENRSWRTWHRGPLAVHAGKSRCRAGLLLPDGTAVDDAGLIYGAVIAVAQIIDCVRISDHVRGPFAEGPWCWLLGRVTPVRPLPWVGRQMLFDIPDDLILGRTLAPPAGAVGRRSETRP